MTSLVEVEHITKRFGGVTALKDISLSLAPAAIHGLVGENGAGKSTLAKIVSGAISPDQGQLVVDGRPVRYRAPHDALRDGITIIAQEISLLPRRSVLRNVFLGREPHRTGIV